MKIRRCDGGRLELGGGLEVLLAAVLETAAPGEEIDVVTGSKAVSLELPAWARLQGHQVTNEASEGEVGSRYWVVRLRRGSANRVLAPPLPEAGQAARLRGGRFQTGDWRQEAGPVPDLADPAGGFVPLGSIAEAGGPRFEWSLNERDRLWSEEVAQLAEGASASQWDASQDIPWAEAGSLPDFLERAVCQVATFIAQNEYAAYYVPARFLPAVNPQYAEVLLWLASHVHDEARHLEVFTKRALLNGAHSYALASTQRSLHSLLEERDFSSSALLLNVLGEGSFLDLLSFVGDHAPDPATATAARLAYRDELRHVRFGIGHVRRVLERDASARGKLVAAAEQRAARLVDLSGMSPVAIEALTILAAGSLQPARIAEGAAAVRQLMKQTARNRVTRLQQAGFDEATARHLSDLHTPNLM